MKKNRKKVKKKNLKNYLLKKRIIRFLKKEKKLNYQNLKKKTNLIKEIKQKKIRLKLKS